MASMQNKTRDQASRYNNGVKFSLVAKIPMDHSTILKGHNPYWA